LLHKTTAFRNARASVKEDALNRKKSSSPIKYKETQSRVAGNMSSIEKAKKIKGRASQALLDEAIIDHFKSGNG
jgi:hypothetical protein